MGFGKGQPCCPAMQDGTGEITSWLDTDKIDRICRAHAQRHSQT